MATTVEAKLSFTLKFGKQEHPCRAADVGRRGVFLLTDARPRQHQLLQIVIGLPSRPDLLVHGMVERVVGYEEAEKEDVPAGVAIRFYGLGRKTRSKWEEIVEGWKAAVETGDSVEGETERDVEEPEEEVVEQAEETAEDDSDPADLDWDSSALLEPMDVGANRSVDAEKSEEPARDDEDQQGEAGEVDDEIQDEEVQAPSIPECEESDEQPTTVFSPVKRAALGKREDPCVKRPAAPWLRDSSMLLRARDTAGDAVSARQSGSSRGGLANWFTPHAHKAPAESVGHVVYRMLFPSVEALQEFASTALKSGGVFVRASDLRPAGTPAVVCIVHPVDQREFHLPGTVRPSSPSRQGVAVKFEEVTNRTIATFHIFIRPQHAPALPPSPQVEAESHEEELSLIQEPALLNDEKPGTRLDENTQEFRVSDLASFVDSQTEEADESS